MWDRLKKTYICYLVIISFEADSFRSFFYPLWKNTVLILAFLFKQQQKKIKKQFQHRLQKFLYWFFFSHFLFICFYECIVTHSVLSVSLSQHSYHKACLAKDFVRWEYLQWSKGPLLHLAGLALGPSHAKWCTIHQHVPFSPKVAAITETIIYFGNEITTW